MLLWLGSVWKTMTCFLEYCRVFSPFLNMEWGCQSQVFYSCQQNMNWEHSGQVAGVVMDTFIKTNLIKIEKEMEGFYDLPKNQCRNKKNIWQVDGKCVIAVLKLPKYIKNPLWMYMELLVWLYLSVCAHRYILYIYTHSIGVTQWGKMLEIAAKSSTAEESIPNRMKLFIITCISPIECAEVEYPVVFINRNLQVGNFFPCPPSPPRPVWNSVQVMPK